MIKPKPNIMIIGSLNMDLVVTTERMPKNGETVQGRSIHYISGGKGANQAVGCAKLGAHVTMVGAVGDDVFGQQIINQLDAYGVATEHIARIKNKSTGTATIIHTLEDNCIVVVSGANGECNKEMVSAYEAYIQKADVLLLQLEIPLSAVHHALKIARSHGVRTVLNPAPAHVLSQDLLSLVDILTPNESEFESISGKTYSSEEELEEGMQNWQNTYGCTLVITRGQKGCSYLDPLNGKLKTIPIIAVHVIDTTGAGDAFNAALCYRISLGWSLEHAIKFAVKAASLSVTKFGAQEGMPTLEEVATLDS
jgi:ribokinase